VKVNPVVQRIHPNSIFSFQVWDKENDDATILLIGENIQDSVVEVCFLNPFWKDKYVVARSKFTRYREKEYYIPCLKKLLEDCVYLPEQAIVVDVFFIVNSIQIQFIQKFTYLSIFPQFFPNDVYVNPPVQNPKNIYHFPH